MIGLVYIGVVGFVLFVFDYISLRFCDGVGVCVVFKVVVVVVGLGLVGVM